MYPTVVIVGRPNVGKSTLFNRLTHSRDALVADLPGLTRDRHYAPARIGRKPFLVVDTGGFEPVAEHGILHEMGKQTLQAIAEADVVVFLLDYRQGLMAQDTAIAEKLRQEAARVIVAVNKAEGIDPASACAEFHELGLGNPVAISAAHGSGVQALLAQLEQRLPTAEPEVSEDDHPRIAVVGRPNVGKSSLLNRLLGEERVVVFDQPGTTRDSIAVTFERRGKRYTLVDTAGIRRRGKVFEAIEKFSVVKTLQAISSANVVLLVMDAIEQISEQDARIAGFVLEQGKAVVIAVNKWDAVDKEQRELVKREVTRKLGFLNFARFHYISAVSGAGTEKLLDSVDDAYQAAMVKLSTPKLTRTLLAATSRHQPPHAGRSRPKLRYAHQGGSNPPIVVIHGNALRSVPDSYRRYLENVFRDTFSLEGTPLRIQFKQSTNPYASKAR